MKGQNYALISRYLHGPCYTELWNQKKKKKPYIKRQKQLLQLKFEING